MEGAGLLVVGPPPCHPASAAASSRSRHRSGWGWRRFPWYISSGGDRDCSPAAVWSREPRRRPSGTPPCTEDGFQGVGQVVDQVPAVGDLGRVGGAVPRPLGVGPARSRAMISTPGCARSQAARLRWTDRGAGRRGGGVRGRRGSCRRSALCGWPSRPRRGRSAPARSTSGSRRMSRSSVSGLTGIPSLRASRAPASPPRAKAMAVSASRWRSVRRA